MGTRLFSVASSLVPALLFLVLPATAEEKAGPGEAVFDMRERSAFTVEQSPPGPIVMLTRGQYAPCTTTPDKEVKAYPKLKSKRPLYGKVTFDPDPVTRKGIEFHFVLDESGEPPAGEEKQDNKKPQGKEDSKSRSRKPVG